MRVNQPKTKAARHFDKTRVPDDIRYAVMRINLSVAATAKLLGVSTGSVEELKNIGGALKAELIEQVRTRLAELAQKEAV
jgi:hypothetical protein